MINKFYTPYNRFWHWTQMLMVILLSVTGWEIHGTYKFFGYQAAVSIHNAAAWGFIILTIFSMFWMALTGEWKQYLPTMNKMGAQIKFYLSGIFYGEPHPVLKSRHRKLNPLQRMVYFLILMITIPFQIITGLIYMYFHLAKNAIGIEYMRDTAILHTIGAFLLIAFLLVHVYLVTTGHTVWSNIKAMFTGYEKSEEHAELEHQ